MIRFRSSLRFILPALIVMSIGTQASARGRSPETPVAPGIPVLAERVFVRALPAGGDGFYAVWNTRDVTAAGTAPLEAASSLSSIVAQRFSADGSAQWAESGLPLARGLSDPGLWDACHDGKGGVVTVAGEKDRLMIRRTDHQGKISSERTVIAYSSGTSVSSVVAIPDGLGGVYVTWAQGDADNSVVWVQLWDASGRPQWPAPGQRVAPSDAHQFQPNILLDGQGGVVVAWKSFQEEVSRIRGQRMTVDGKRLWTEAGIGVQTPAGDLHQRITMVAPGSGSLVVAWTQGVEGVNRLFFQRIEPDGARSWSGGGLTGNPPILEQWNPVLLADGERSVWIGWEQVGLDSAAKVKLIRRGPPNGEAWAPGEIGLANTDGNQGKIALTLDGTGGVLAAWIENRTDVSVYLQQLDSAGRLRYPTGYKVASGLKHPQYPHMVLAAAGRAALVWVEEAGKNIWTLNHRVADFR